MTDSGALVLPELEGQRVRLRAFSRDDVPTILDAATDQLIPVLTTVPSTQDPALAAAFIDRQHERAASGQGYSFAIADRADVAVGQIGLWLRNLDHGRASVGYWIAPAARRQGYALDALRTLAAWAEQLPQIDRLELYVEPWNEGSWRTAERAGFNREGLLRSWERVGPERRDMFMYSRVSDSSTRRTDG
ncbi:GNAT family protein [Amnibacterium soli]|uniref:GNAT family protein n=1 Tax=Amnibacterium soli TaxID=1282736 RepID=A0ABP8ZG15_9MICO